MIAFRPLAVLLLILPAPAMAQANRALELIDAVIASPPRDRASAERLFGHTLTRTSTNYIVQYWGKDIPLGDGVTATIELRRSAPEMADEGALLIVDLAGTCIARHEVFKRYPGFDYFDSPNHPSPLAETYFGHDVSWGRYSFGFTEEKPDCLASFVLDLAPLTPPS